jgi:hypothetical protein
MGMADGLAQQLAAKVSEVKSIVSGISEEDAAQKPAADEWCANEVLSHLIGEELGDWKARIELIVKEDTPLIDLTPGISYTEKRTEKTTSALLSAFETDYAAFGKYLGSLTDEQLSRKAHVPLFKESPLGEYPTLAQFATGIINYHVADHVQQLRNLCQ